MKPDTPTKEIDTLLGPNRFPKVWEQRYIGSFSPTQRFSNLLIFHFFSFAFNVAETRVIGKKYGRLDRNLPNLGSKLISDKRSIPRIVPGTHDKDNGIFMGADDLSL